MSVMGPDGKILLPGGRGKTWSPYGNTDAEIRENMKTGHMPNAPDAMRFTPGSPKTPSKLNNQEVVASCDDGQEPAMGVGDLVKINKTCDAGGLFGEVGIIVGFPPPLLNGPLVRVLLRGRSCVLRQSAVDIL